MAATRTTGIYMLQTRHTASLAALADACGHESDGLARALHHQGAEAFVAARIAEREEGSRHTFAIEDRGQVLGLCALALGDDDRGRAEVWVAEPFRRRGHGAFALGMLLEFAFTNRRLDTVEASADDEPARRLLARWGFAAPGDEGPRRVLTAAAFQGRRHAPALARLVPALKAIVDAELAAGNEVVETSTDWPEPGSILVRLRRPFCVAHGTPEGVRYAELNDPHWWKAEYATGSPRQFVVH
ncbi:MAG TPA: GNAT family N-acetyltransferase [Planctomycetota bacterium]|nr:GNAT family N-acetyltransferase [Planctomycetota bacterium]